MINLSTLVFEYPNSDFTLAVPELKIAAAEKAAVIGPSGSGKTTLLNLVAGITLPKQGCIEIDGTVINRLDDGARRNFRITRIGFVFQRFELLDYLDVLDNILHPYRITGALVLDSGVRERACSLAEQMGLGNKLHRRIGRLSQGEMQRAAICRALLPQPRLILADEATGNLDPENKRMILDLLFEAVDRDNATLLAVTHDHALLQRFDRVIDFGDFQAQEIGAAE